jgi:4-amino-4-deoxy-L-arabinose transferase-like glycosyltransferase
MRYYWVIVASVLLLTCARIATTYLVFAQTLDEPAHVAAGHEWLTKGTYHLDFEHPPLARMLFALPFLGQRAQQTTDEYAYGDDLYAHDDRYIHNVAWPRRLNLLFVGIAALALAAVARRLFGDAVSIVALLLFVSLPPVLAHGGLATTDMAGVAGFAVALDALLRWSDEPSWRRTMLLGAAIAFGVCCKYSFIFFFPPAIVIVLIVRRRLALGRLVVAAVVASVVTWGVFGFRFAAMDTNPEAASMVRTVGLPEWVIHTRVPAPDFFMGLLAVHVHNHAGHPAYLFGHVSHTGWWYYFPVVLAVKTPIPFLLLSACGAWLLFRRRHAAAFLILIAAAILAITMTARINIGVRHILPIYLPLSIVAAYAVVELWRINPPARTFVAAALGWLLLSSALAHPDYIPWMNAFAGKHPERVLLDSNFDWGQDIWRLATICRKRGITTLGYAVMTNVRPSSVGIAGGAPLNEHVPSHGWIVLSEHNLHFALARNPQAYRWLDRYPFERVGKTLRLYHLP